MNRRQRKRVTRWIVLAAVIAGVIVLESLFKSSSWAFRGILYFGLFVALILERPTAGPAESSSNRIACTVRNNPWIKGWLLVCALGAIALAVAAVYNDLDLGEQLGFGGLFGAILLVGAPIIVMGERERFLECGTPDHAD